MIFESKGLNFPPQGLVRVDFHVHTAYSPDGFSTPEQLLHVCRRKGITGLAITDHNTIEGALVCKKVLPLTVIVGEEVKTRSGEVIGLFLTKPIPAGLAMLETIARIREQGGLVCLPHPFDNVRSSRIGGEELSGVAAQADMIEVFNSYSLFKEADRRALELALSAKKLKTVGSDAHIAGEVGRAYVEMKAFSGKEELLANLREGNLHTRKTPLTVRGFIKIRKKLRSFGVSSRRKEQG